MYIYLKKNEWIEWIMASLLWMYHNWHKKILSSTFVLNTDNIMKCFEHQISI